ncbi:MAG: hypothetical protein M1818_004781 [Claussenomyces sp. TS43310]|nr:MAG: hypothetical protein M1818_004781 [Claussenomyces sp. TS43310]
MTENPDAVNASHVRVDGDVTDHDVDDDRLWGQEQYAFVNPGTYGSHSDAQNMEHATDDSLITLSTSTTGGIHRPG